MYYLFNKKLSSTPLVFRPNLVSASMLKGSWWSSARVEEVRADGCRVQLPPLKGTSIKVC